MKRESKNVRRSRSWTSVSFKLLRTRLEHHIAVRANFDDPAANFEERVNQGFDKVVTKNIWTGRSVQNLVCRICSKSINKLCNMKDHVRRHLQILPF